MGIGPARIECEALRLQDKEIREQLSRLLGSPFFCHSKRLPSLLGLVVELTLSGSIEEIKERTLGVQIFGRKLDYETATDPIVRVTAAEIRKRLAQYYMEPGHEQELRITLPTGSYVPRFEWPNLAAAPLSSDETQQCPQEAQPVGGSASIEKIGLDVASGIEMALSKPDAEAVKFGAQVGTKTEQNGGFTVRRISPVKVLIALTASLLVAATVFIARALHPSPIDYFWGPVVASKEPVLICVADQLQDTGIALRDTTDPSRMHWSSDTQKKNAFSTVVFDDVNVVAMLIQTLQSERKQYLLKGEAATNLSDLRSGSAIFVGGFDNAWTLRMTSSLRFRFANDPGMAFPRIVDSADSGDGGWKTDQSKMGNVGTYRDYALVARFTDSTTGKPAVIVAGIGRCGSLAAGQFVSDPQNLAELEHAARKVGNKMNLEAVLSTEVVDGQAGSPKIEAAYFW